MSFADLDLTLGSEAKENFLALLSPLCGASSSARKLVAGRRAGGFLCLRLPLSGRCRAPESPFSFCISVKYKIEHKHYLTAPDLITPLNVVGLWTSPAAVTL